MPPKQEPEAPTLTAEQQEAERKKEMRRDREREQNRLRMQRVRAAQKAALQAEDMAKGVYLLTSSLPQAEPQRAANL